MLIYIYTINSIIEIDIFYITVLLIVIILYNMRRVVV